MLLASPFREEHLQALCLALVDSVNLMKLGLGTFFTSGEGNETERGLSSYIHSELIAEDDDDTDGGADRLVMGGFSAIILVVTAFFIALGRT